MKTKILAIVYSAILFLGMVSCQEPEEFHPNVERNGINNLTASFLNDDRDENSFSSEIDYSCIPLQLSTFVGSGAGEVFFEQNAGGS